MSGTSCLGKFMTSTVGEINNDLLLLYWMSSWIGLNLWTLPSP